MEDKLDKGDKQEDIFRSMCVRALYPCCTTKIWIGVGVGRAKGGRQRFCERSVEWTDLQREETVNEF